MNINNAKDPRLSGRSGSTSALQKAPADQSATADNEAGSHPAGAIPLATSGRRWTVRVHWGIVFAIVASVILWFVIKTVVQLAL